MAISNKCIFYNKAWSNKNISGRLSLCIYEAIFFKCPTIILLSYTTEENKTLTHASNYILFTSLNCFQLLLSLLWLMFQRHINSVSYLILKKIVLRQMACKQSFVSLVHSIFCYASRTELFSVIICGMVELS